LGFIVEEIPVTWKGISDSHENVTYLQILTEVAKIRWRLKSGYYSRNE